MSRNTALSRGIYALWTASASSPRPSRRDARTNGRSTTACSIDLLLVTPPLSLRDVVGGLRSDDVHYYEPYERVHWHNVELVRAQ